MSDQLQLFPTRPPVIVAYGGGVDSTALLIEFARRGIMPDLILMADTGGEKPETYAYLPVIQNFLAAHQMPPVVMVRANSKHAGLEAECGTLQTLPSLAFGMKTCSLKWKVGPQNIYCNAWPLARQAWAVGLRVQKIIGYDANPNDAKRGTFGQDGRGAAKCVCCRANPCRKYTYRFPLIEWGYDRTACIDIIRAAGLPVPIKSACFFCPASKAAEITWLKREHPDLHQRALKMEHGFLTGRHPARSTKGLGRCFAWNEVAP